jgi:hypothetical protein
MKQHITTDQLNELTLEQKERLRGRWEPTGEGLCCCTNDTCGPQFERYVRLNDPKIKKKWLPLLSVGQCIELLHTKDEIHIDITDARITITFKTPPSYSWNDMGLIDRLWDGVKKVL